MHDNLISIDYNTCSSVAFKQKERIWYKFVFSPLDAQSSKPPKINILHMGNKMTDYWIIKKRQDKHIYFRLNIAGIVNKLGLVEIQVNM